MHGFLKFKKLFILLFIILSAGCSRNPVVPDEDKKKSDDREIYGLDAATSLWGLVTDEKSRPLPGILVSDGFDVTKTDHQGIYQLRRNSKARFVYYTTPAAFKINVTLDNQPDFYAKIDQSKSLIRQDFKLTAQNEEEKWTLICVGDPQPTTADDVERYRSETIKDISNTVEALRNAGMAVYAITLGDLVHNKPELYPLMKMAMSNKVLPFFQVLGNHDHIVDVGDDKAHEEYEDHFGPRNYSFDRGNVHIVALDNYINLNNLDDKPTGGLTDDIWTWLKADLAEVPKDKMVILCAHVPFRQGTVSTHGKDVVDLLKTFNEAHIMTGHTHTNEKWKHDDNSSSKLTEHTHGTACGAHWRSKVCLDGTPNGYAVYSINGNHISDYYYKATGDQYDRSYQMRLYDGGYDFYSKGSGYNFNTVFGEADNRVVANIWNGDPTWQVSLEEEGYAPLVMAQATQDVTDWCAYTYHLYYKNKLWTGETKHFWHGRLRSGKKPAEATFSIKARDVRNNMTYTTSSSPAKPNIQFNYDGIAYP